MEHASIAALLAVAAGMLNAWTLAQTHSFATVQSGNIVSAGAYVVSGNTGPLLQVGLSILAFAAGAFLCAVVVNAADRFQRNYSPWILTAESVLLVGLVGLAVTPIANVMFISAALSFVAGIQGNAFHRESGLLYGNVAVTFVLQGASAYVGRAASRALHDDGEPHLRRAATYALVLVGFALGGAIGYALHIAWSPAPILATAITTGILAAIARHTRTTVDPAQNAPTS